MKCSYWVEQHWKVQTKITLLAFVSGQNRSREVDGFRSGGRHLLGLLLCFCLGLQPSHGAAELGEGVALPPWRGTWSGLRALCYFVSVSERTSHRARRPLPGKGWAACQVSPSAARLGILFSFGMQAHVLSLCG